MRRRLTLLTLLLVVGCASGPRELPVRSVPAADGEHPLVGRTWSVRDGALVPSGALHDAVRRADFVLLGEVHDNAHHHRVQAELVGAAAKDRRPALAFEMIDSNLQPKVDAAEPSPRAIAEAVEWERSGWPDFAMYQPIFEAAQTAALPVIAANLPRATAREVVKEGLSVLEPELRAAVERRWPLPDEVIAARREEMKVAHCGHFPEQMLQPMVLAQLARDVHLAQRLIASATAHGAVLIAGNGHVRSDSGVPSILSAEAPEREVISIGILEVDPQAVAPADYAAEFGGELPFDFVVFTPAAEREDPCQALRKRSEP